ncbi:MAG: cell wall hydrolase [Lachnospiraceae bacterium]
MKVDSKKLFRLIMCMAVTIALSIGLGEATVLATGIDGITSLHIGAAEVVGEIDTLSNDEIIYTARLVQEEKEREASTGLFMATVTTSMNVREEPNAESKKVGYLYADCGGEILEKVEGWTKIKSGNLIGWANDEYLVFGTEALTIAKDVGRTIATINADTLRVRKEGSEEAEVWGLVEKGETLEAVEEESTDQWLAINFEGDLGYISAEYAELNFKVDHGETFDEIEEREKKEKAEKLKKIASEGASALGTTDEVLLAALIQCEAGNQPYEGQVAVGAVVINRMKSGAYPNTLAGVIYASGQFTPAASGKVEARINKGVKDSCLQAARAALNGETTVGGAMHFRRAGSRDGIVIGNHVFW